MCFILKNGVGVFKLSILLLILSIFFFYCGCLLEHKCIPHCCNIANGAWSDYGDWSECDGSEKTRTRTCDKPAPANGGSNCEGADIDTESCGKFSQLQVAGVNHYKYFIRPTHRDLPLEIIYAVLH